MAAGYVPNSPLTTFYSNTTAGTPASPDAVDAAVQAIVQTVNENYEAAQEINNGLSGHKNNTVLDHPDQSVTTAKIKDLNVTTPKLADGAVTTAKQADLSVTRVKIALGAVGPNQLDPALLNDYGDIAVQAALALKANQTALDSTNTLKADKTYVDTQMAAVASGSPKGTYATLTALQTAFPSGNGNIYLVTADGNWYYWNGSAWTAGGVYQSTGIADKAVIPEKTNFAVGKSNNLVNPYLYVGKNLNNSTGAIFDSVSFASTEFIQVAIGDVLHITRKYTLGITVSSLLQNVLAYDPSKVFISPKNTTLITETAVNDVYVRYTINFNGYLRLSASNSVLNELSITKIYASYEPYVYELNDLFIKTPVTNVITVTKNMVDESKSVYGFLNVFGTITNSATYKTTDFIKIDKSQNYIITPSIRKLGFYNENKHPIYTDPFIDADTASYVLNSTAAYYVRFSYRVIYDGQMQMEKGNTGTAHSPYKVTIPNLESGSSIDLSHYDLNPLWGKALLGFGDSIAAGDGAGGVGWTERIGQKYGMTYNDYAVGGATVTVISGNTNNILKRINDAITNSLPADYILFDGLTNDASTGGIVTGSISTGYSATLDTATFCGAFEQMIKTMRLNWLGAKIVYVRVHNMDSRGSQQITYGDLAVQMCKKWSIPIVDMYNEGGLNTQLQEFKNVYTDAGGTHPNALGYDKFYVPTIESKLKTI